MKTIVSWEQTQLKTLLSYAWGLTIEKQDILDTATHIFSSKLPLKYRMEDKTYRP